MLLLTCVVFRLSCFVLSYTEPKHDIRNTINEKRHTIKVLAAKIAVALGVWHIRMKTTHKQENRFYQMRLQTIFIQQIHQRSHAGSAKFEFAFVHLVKSVVCRVMIIEIALRIRRITA